MVTELCFARRYAVIMRAAGLDPNHKSSWELMLRCFPCMVAWQQTSFGLEVGLKIDPKVFPFPQEHLLLLGWVWMLRNASVCRAKCDAALCSAGLTTTLPANISLIEEIWIAVNLVIRCALSNAMHQCEHARVGVDVGVCVCVGVCVWVCVRGAHAFACLLVGLGRQQRTTLLSMR